MSDPPPRSPISAGIEWATRISTLGLTFFLPGLLGHLADRRFGSGPWVLLVGMVAGFVVGMMQLLGLARDSSGPRQGPR